MKLTSFRNMSFNGKCILRHLHVYELVVNSASCRSMQRSSQCPKFALDISHLSIPYMLLLYYVYPNQCFSDYVRTCWNIYGIRWCGIYRVTVYSQVWDCWYTGSTLPLANNVRYALSEFDYFVCLPQRYLGQSLRGFKQAALVWM